MERETQKKFDYKWVIAVMSFVVVFTILGFYGTMRSLSIKAITDALPISRTQYALSDSVRYLTTSAINLFFGFFVMKFGYKKLIGMGFIFSVLSCIFYAKSETLFGFCLAGLCMGFCSAWTGTAMIGAIIGRWFKENRGSVMGVVLAANGLGIAISAPILSPIVTAGGPFGYRKAYLVVAAIFLVVGIIAMFVIRDKKDDEDVPAAGAKKKGRVWVGIEFDELKKKWFFYGALFCIFVAGMILQSITSVATPLMQDVGLPAAYVTLNISVHAVALTIFKITVGVIYDKKGLRTTANLCFATAVIVMMALANVTNTKLGMVIAMFYSIFAAFALPLETIMLPIFSGDLFGEKAYNKVLGLFTSACTLGYASGGPITNLCFDLTGSYNIAIYIAAGIMLVATVVMQFVISASNKEKMRIESEITAEN